MIWILRWLVALPALLVPTQEPGEIRGKVSLPEERAGSTRAAVRYPENVGRQRPKPPPPCPVVIYLEGVPAAAAAEGRAEIKQEGLQFHPRAVAIQRGMKVSFPNSDKDYHNVFSYSKPKRFDLGRYPEGETREVTFEQPGIVKVYCEIHEHMRATILVIDHSKYTTAREDGTFALTGVPPGRYTLVAWHDRFEPVRHPVEVKAATPVQVELKFARAGMDDAREVRAASCCGGR